MFPLLRYFNTFLDAIENSFSAQGFLYDLSLKQKTQKFNGLFQTIQCSEYWNVGIFGVIIWSPPSWKHMLTEVLDTKTPNPFMISEKGTQIYCKKFYTIIHCSFDRRILLLLLLTQLQLSCQSAQPLIKSPAKLGYLY